VKNAVILQAASIIVPNSWPSYCDTVIS